MKNKILILIMLIMILPIINAQTYKPGIETELKFTCTSNGAIPSAGAEFRISIDYPNGSELLPNTLTTPQGEGLFNYTIIFPEIGEYTLHEFCYDTPYSFSNTEYLIVTATGSDMNTSKAISYFLIFVICFVVLVFLIICAIYLPSKNESDQMTGYIIAVSNLKYLKAICYGFAYLVAMFLAYFSWMVTYAYLDFPFLTKLFQFSFYAMVVALLPGFILFCYFVIANWVRDAKIGEYLSRGLKVK